MQPRRVGDGCEFGGAVDRRNQHTKGNHGSGRRSENGARRKGAASGTKSGAKSQKALPAAASEEDSGVADPRVGDVSAADAAAACIDRAEKQAGCGDDSDGVDALAALGADADLDAVSGQGGDDLDDDDFDVVCSTDDDDDDDDDDDHDADGREKALHAHENKASEDDATPKTLPALIPSPFPTRPPVIRFCYAGDNVQVEPLESSLHQGLKWKFQSTTPNLVKKMVRRVGFHITEKNGWIGTWGKHLKATSFRHLRADQKLNHFPGSFQLGRKDRMWRNVAHMQARHGRKHFDFVPDTYCLPGDLQLLKRAWDAAGSAGKWIMKPNASARGIGIRVIYQWSQVPKRKNYLVQRYLSRPYLINGAKFDLRVYVYVSSFDPLKIYICREGLARFATQKYSNKKSKLRNRYMHLTNYSINKKSSKFVQNDDVSMCQGHKWGLQALWKHMREQDGVDTDRVWESICDIVIKTLLSVDSTINSAVKFNCKSGSVCHELFGFDIMLSSNLKPYLIEVNISPSMASSSPLDKDIKGRLLRDVFNIAGFIPPAYRSGYRSDTLNEAIWKDRGTKAFSSHLSQNERQKHAYFVQHYEDLAAKGKLHTILDNLTDDDVCMLMEAEEEFARKGDLDRLVPSPAFESNFRFMDTPRYYNVLLSEWCKRYHLCPNKGVEYLQTISEQALARAQSGTLRTRQPALTHATAFTSSTQFYMSPSRPKGRHNLPSIARTRSHQASARERGGAAEGSAQDAGTRRRAAHTAPVRLTQTVSAPPEQHNHTEWPHAPGQAPQQQGLQQGQKEDTVDATTRSQPRSLSTAAGVVRDRTGRMWRVRNADAGGGTGGGGTSSASSGASSAGSTRRARPPAVAVTHDGGRAGRWGRGNGGCGNDEDDDGVGTNESAIGGEEGDGGGPSDASDGSDAGGYEDIFGGDEDDNAKDTVERQGHGDGVSSDGDGGGDGGGRFGGEIRRSGGRPLSRSGELKGKELLSAVLRDSSKGRHRTHYHQHHHPRPVFRPSSRSSRSSSRNSSSRPSSALPLRSPTASLSSTSLSAALDDVRISNWSARSTMRRQPRVQCSADDDDDDDDDGGGGACDNDNRNETGGEDDDDGDGDLDACDDGGAGNKVYGNDVDAAPPAATTTATTSTTSTTSSSKGSGSSAHSARAAKSHRSFVAASPLLGEGDGAATDEEKERAYREHSMTAMLHQTLSRSMHATASAADMQPRQLLLQQQQQQHPRPGSARIGSATQPRRWAASSRISSGRRRLSRGQTDSGFPGRSITRSRAVSAASEAPMLRNVDITFVATPRHQGSGRSGAANRAAVPASRAKRGRRGSTLSVTGTRYDSASRRGDDTQRTTSRAQVLNRLARYK